MVLLFGIPITTKIVFLFVGYWSFLYCILIDILYVRIQAA